MSFHSLAVEKLVEGKVAHVCYEEQVEEQGAFALNRRQTTTGQAVSLMSMSTCQRNEIKFLAATTTAAKAATNDNTPDEDKVWQHQTDRMIQEIMTERG